jgi:hypothetical protein
MPSQNYNYVVVPNYGLDTITVTGNYEPPRRPNQPPIKFTRVEVDQRPFPQAVLVPLTE